MTTVEPELWRRSALELARLVATKQVSSREVVEAHIERIDAVNPTINAVTIVRREQALDEATRADDAVMRGELLGPFHGVPFSSKENLDLVGVPTTQGLVALADSLPPIDSPVIERMRAAGAIALARTNMPELGLRVHTTNPLRRLTRNPWNLARTAGGSSGGEAAAIATGMSPFGLGNDIGGSLRNPAACCGIAALKPGFGRIPKATSLETRSNVLASQQMSVEGPLARHVADLRAQFAVLAGPHPRDPLSFPIPVSGGALDTPIKVAVVTDPPGGTTDPAIVAGVEAAAMALADAGYAVEYVTPPHLVELADLWARWLIGEMSVLKELLVAVMSPDSLKFLGFGEERYGRPTFDESVQLQVRRNEIARDWSVFMARYPVVLGPGWTHPPFEHDFDISGFAGAQATFDRLRFIVPFNVLALPACALASGVSDGLPTGIQVIGDRGREDVVLDAAEAIEHRLRGQVSHFPYTGA